MKSNIVSQAIHNIYDAARGKGDRTISGVSLKSSTAALCSTERMSGRYRRQMLRSRDRVPLVPVIGTAPTEAPIRLARILKGYTMARLAREATQCFNRTRRAQAKLSKLHPKSPMVGLLQSHIVDLSDLATAVRTEIESRMPVKASLALAA